MEDNKKDNQKDDIQSAEVIESKINNKDLKNTDTKDTQTVKLNETVKTDETADIHFSNEDELKNFVRKKTNPKEHINKDKGEDEPIIEKIVENKTNNIKPEESFLNMSDDDFKTLSEFLIDILDTVISTALRFYAKDTSDSEYSIKIEKKQKLSKLLATILVKHQVKLKLEFLFIFTILVIYWAPVQKAHENRKKYDRIKSKNKSVTIKKEDNIENKKDDEDNKEDNKNDNIKEDNKKDNKKEDNKNEGNIRKPIRSAGRPRKN